MRPTQRQAIDRALTKLVEDAKAAAHAGSQDPQGAELLRVTLEAQEIRVRVLMEMYDSHELRVKVAELHTFDRLIESLSV